MPVPDPQDLMALHRLEADRIACISRGDVTALAGLLAHDYVHVHASAAVTDRDATLTFVAGHPRMIEPRTPDIRVYGDVAVLVGDMVNVVPDEGGKTDRVPMIVTQVARRNGSGWVFCSFHGTRYAER